MGMKKFIFLSSLVLLAACESESARLARESKEANARYEAAASATAEAKASLAEVDDNLAWMIAKNNEDPAKANRLLSQCQAETGAQMEGQGALVLSGCIRDKW
jgi:hypothetical protein